MLDRENFLVPEPVLERDERRAIEAAERFGGGPGIPRLDRDQHEIQRPLGGFPRLDPDRRFGRAADPEAVLPDGRELRPTSHHRHPVSTGEPRGEYATRGSGPEHENMKRIRHRDIS